jgi:hypothetical protein
VASLVGDGFFLFNGLRPAVLNTLPGHGFSRLIDVIPQLNIPAGERRSPGEGRRTGPPKKHSPTGGCRAGLALKFMSMVGH